MSVFLRLVLPYPPSDNDVYAPARGRGIVRNHKAVAYMNDVRRLRGDRLLFGDVIWSGTFFRPRRARDVNNGLKLMMDALEDVAYLNDAQVVGFGRYFRSDDEPKNPRVELLLEGERWATTEEVVEAALKRANASAQARATRNANRARRRIQGLASAYHGPAR